MSAVRVDLKGCRGSAKSATSRVGNIRQKNNSAEDGIDGTKGYFRRNSGYSAEQKILKFRSEPFRGRENNSEFRSEPFRGRENNSDFRSVDQKKKHTLGIPFRTLQNNSEFRSVELK